MSDSIVDAITKFSLGMVAGITAIAVGMIEVGLISLLAYIIKSVGVIV